MNKVSEQNLIKLLSSLKHDPESLPRDSFRTNARIRLINQISDKQVTNFPSGTKRFWQLVTAAILTPAILGVGTVLAAQTAKPTDILFPVKIASEKIVLQLAPGKDLKTSVALGLLNRRAQETKAANQNQDKHDIEESDKANRMTIEEIRRSPEASHDAVKRFLENEPEIKKEIEKPETNHQNPTPTPATGEIHGSTIPILETTPVKEQESHKNGEHDLPLSTPSINPTPKD